MPIIVSDGFAERGKQDARRHREKIKDSLKKHLPDIIADESIITGSRKGRTVKIPIRSLSIPHFRPGKKGRSIGVGQGEGEVDDIIGRRKGGGQPGKPGKPGNTPGEDYLETEIEIEELIEMMLEDLGLPRLEEKAIREIEVVMGFKIKGLQSSGIWPLLDRERSFKNGIKRFWAYLQYLKQETGKSETDCFAALKQAHGILGEAVELAQKPDFFGGEVIVTPFPIYETGDLRYRKIVENVANRSNAVMIAMMDVSGSMDNFKKYLARSMLFWLVEFLRRIYTHVEVRFIIHHTEAKLVDEDSFFRTGESGGTFSHTAFDLAGQLVDEQYPTSSWNIYGFYFSDGEDFDTDKTIQSLRKFMDRGINMLGYGEICLKDTSSSFGVLLSAITKAFHLASFKGKGDHPLETVSGGRNLPFLGMKIKAKENVLPALKEFLKKDRWVET